MLEHNCTAFCQPSLTSCAVHGTACVLHVHSNQAKYLRPYDVKSKDTVFKAKGCQLELR